MRKLFTLAAAVLTSFSLWAQTTLATFEVTLTADPTSPYASYSDDDATYTCSKVGSNSSSNFYKASNDKYYLKLTGDDGFIQIKLKDGNFAAGDTVFYALNHSQKKTGIGFKFNKSSNTATTDMTAAGTEVIGKYTLTAGDLEDDGSIKMLRASSNTFVNRIYVVRTDAAPVTDPVASVTIEGPTEAAVGYAATYTATTDVKADAYQWFVDDVAQDGATKKTFAFTPAVKGATYAIVCKARNDNNATDEWIASTAINVTGTKLCGELIKATHTGDKTADVTGVVGGTVDKSTQAGGKLGSNGHFFGIKLESGSFMAGDVVTCVATALSGGNTATLFSDKGTTPLGSAEFDTESKTATITLTKSADWIYLYRADGNVCNPTMGSISVTRSCEDSNDATIHSLTVNGNEVAENDGVFEYTLSASYEEPTVTIAFEIHPLATIKYSLSNPYEMETPAVGDSRGQAFTIIAEDGTEKTYTVFIYKSASLSNDATLKALSVAGLTLNPDFAADVTEYTVTKAYEAAMPEVSAVTATPNSSDAKGAEVTITGNVITIVVTAENDDTKTYTITVNNAPAVKKINEVILSNGYSAYIVEGQSVEPFVINGFYLAGQDAPTVSSYQVNDGTTWAIDGNNITLTGADNSIALYSLVLAEVAPVEFSADEITFDGAEAWAKAANGFDASKGGWKFSKTDSDFSREIAGKTHVEFFLPACDTIVLKAGASGTERDVRFYVNGTEVGDKAKLTKAGVTLVVEQAAPFMLTVASAQTGGDGGVGAIRMAKAAETPTAISNTEAEVKAVKFIENGQFFILKNGIKYNANGAIVK